MKLCQWRSRASAKCAREGRWRVFSLPLIVGLAFVGGAGAAVTSEQAKPPPGMAYIAPDAGDQTPGRRLAAPNRQHSRSTPGHRLQRALDLASPTG